MYDDIDFLEKLPRNTDNKKILLTLDVTNMYTNIDNKLGKEAIKYWLEKYPELIPGGISKEFMFEGLSIVLECNTFTFSGRIYLQIKGVSMGTKLAPTYVNLVMAYLEIRFYQIIGEKCAKDIIDKYVKEWLRYQDDCFLNWDLTIDTTENLLKIIYPSIEFEKEESKTEANYLDIKILVKDNKIITDLFRKQTDSQHYVPFISSHPSHTKRTYPLIGLARRICTIVEEKDTRDQRLIELQNTLVKQRYPVQLVEFGAQKATKIPIEDLRKPKDKDKEETLILTFLSTFNPRNPDMFKVIKDTLPLLDANPRMKKALKNIKLINSKHQPSNLKKLLTRARFELSTIQQQEHQGVKKSIAAQPKHA